MTEEENNWVIHKQEIISENIGVDGYYETMLPFGARILTVQVQREEICMWYQWDLKAKDDEPMKRAFIIIGTGWEVNVEKFHLIQYLGTVQLMGGSLVFHIFEVEVKK